MSTTTTKLYYLSNIDNLRDPVRTTLWRLLIPSTVFSASGLSVTNGDSFASSSGTDDFALHIKEAKIPDIKNKIQKQWYMGFNKAHVVQTDMSTDQQYKGILLEDMRAYEAIIAWEQACQNTGLLVDDSNLDRMNQTGLRLGLGNHKDVSNSTNAVVINSNVKVELYNWMTGDVILTIKLINAFPTDVKGPQLTYDNADIAYFNFTLHADRWTVHIPSSYASGLS